MSTLSKIEHAGRAFYYDARGHTHIQQGTIKKGDLLFLDSGDSLRCYPAFWDDIGRPLAEFPLGALRPVKSPIAPDTRTWGEQFIDMIDNEFPNNKLVGTIATSFFLALLVIIGGLILFL